MAKKTTKKAAKPKKAAAAKSGGAKRASASTKKAVKPAKPVKASKPAPARPTKKAEPAKRPAPKRPAAKPQRPAPATKPTRVPIIRAPEPDDDELDEQLDTAPPEPPLTPEEVEEFHEMLLQKRRQIQGDLGSLQNEALDRNRRDASGDLSSMPLHMADIGSDNYEMEFTLGLLESERSTLREIDEALERIRKGVYGICLGTGKPIGKARLRAKPWAKYCYEYTLAQENQGRRY